MLSIDDCSECNRSRGSQFSYMGQYNGGHIQQPIHRNGPERRRTPVHDRLGKRVDPQEQLKEEADALFLMSSGWSARTSTCMTPTPILISGVLEACLGPRREDCRDYAIENKKNKLVSKGTQSQ